MSRWSERQDVSRGDSYDERWRQMKSDGASVHGEADCIESLGPRSVLDAGCGTGRVAIELAARGIDVVGVDLDPVMLDAARQKAPALEWIAHDLVDLRVPDATGATRSFDVVALAGNVMIFVEPGTEADVVSNLARHLAPGGLMIAGFQLRDDRLTLSDYDAACAGGGLELRDRWATWARDEFEPEGSYAVSVHRLRDTVG